MTGSLYWCLVFRKVVPHKVSGLGRLVPGIAVPWLSQLEAQGGGVTLPRPARLPQGPPSFLGIGLGRARSVISHDITERKPGASLKSESDDARGAGRWNPCIAPPDRHFPLVRFVPTSSIPIPSPRIRSNALCFQPHAGPSPRILTSHATPFQNTAGNIGREWVILQRAEQVHRMIQELRCCR